MFLKCRKKQKVKTSKGKLMLLSECGVPGKNNSSFIKEQNISGFLSNLRSKKPWSKILLFGNIFLKI